MNKQQFLTELREGLKGLPQEDIERSAEFYGEMIDDRIEDGMTEEEATATVGPVGEIISQILSETSLPKLVKAKVKPDRALKGAELLLLILGIPVWLPLVIAAAIIVLAVFIVIWSVVISLYAIDLSFAIGFAAGILGSLSYIFTADYAAGVLLIGAGLICGGTTVLLFLAFNQITKGMVLLSRNILLMIKACFLRKGGVQ